MSRSPRILSFVVALSAPLACGGDDAPAQDDESSSSSSSAVDSTTHAPSSGPSDEGPATTMASTTTTATTMTTEGDSTSSGGDSVGEAETGEPPACEACNSGAPISLKNGDTGQLNPGRGVSETGDGRGVAASHFYFDELVSATVFDPVGPSWGVPQTLRDAGPWEEQQHTRVEVRPTPDGAVVFEDANGRLFAHQLAGDSWDSAELTSVPDKRYILNVTPAPDGRIAVLLTSEVAWDQPAALYLAYYDVAGAAWSPGPEVFIDDPTLEVLSAEILFASDDGDAMVSWLAPPFDWNWPMLAEVRHFDAQTQHWTSVYEYSGYVWWSYLRELEPGEFVFYPEILEVEGGSYFFTEETGFGEQTDVPFPDDYVDGELRKAWFDTEANVLGYRTYTREDPVGVVDELDISLPTAGVDYFATQLTAKHGRAYAFWPLYGADTSARVAVHTDAGWSTPTVLQHHPNSIGPSYLAVNDEGDAAVSWSPSCGGPCPGDPTMVARYDAEADCWNEAMALEAGADGYTHPFSTTRDFLVTSVGDDFYGQMLSCP
ncbi:MAG TPA: hypothetical protein VG755_14200 [Nannocystaceae bacterium]|nr:hypothetical protein [Nannocystaceae bacterium]